MATNRFFTPRPVECHGTCDGQITDGFVTSRGLMFCDHCYAARERHKATLTALLARINRSADPAEALWQALSEEHAVGEGMGFSAACYQVEKRLAKAPKSKRLKALLWKLQGLHDSTVDEADWHRAQLDDIAPA